MKTIIELMTALSSAKGASEAAQIATDSGLTGAKEIYMAWGKSAGMHSVKELEEFWKLCQPVKTSGGPRGFADSYYDWLAETSREEQEAADYILSSESQNVRNHLTHYLNIWALAETVRRGKKVVRTVVATKEAGEPKVKPQAKAKERAPEWEYNASAPYGDVKSAWETLKREREKARPAKTKVHPDKVAHLNDAELSKAYTEAFQVYSK